MKIEDLEKILQFSTQLLKNLEQSSIQQLNNINKDFG
jgi:hypothetical protein